MKPIKTKETNHSFGPPPGKEDLIGNLPCSVQEVEDLGVFIYSVYKPTDEERQAIADGWNIRLGVGWIGSFPPVSVGITHLGEL